MSYAKIRPRRGTKTEWNMINPVLMEGELGIECPDTGVGTGLSKFKIGDGFKKWADLPYAFDATAANAVYGGNVSISHDICLRCGTTIEWETTNPILKLGEIVFDITKGAIKIGDGQHTFKQLDYIGYTWEMEDNYDFGDIDLEPITPPSPDDQIYDFQDIDNDWII